MGEPKRSSAYVKANDEKYRLNVISRDPKASHVEVLQCRFCIFFLRESKVGSKRKSTNNVQAWRSPFRYENDEAHLENQHPSIWSKYTKLT